MVQHIINETELPRALIARLAGVNEATVWAWLRPDTGKAGRAPRPESIHKLAAGLREYGSKLEALAAELDGAAGQGGSSGE